MQSNPPSLCSERENKKEGIEKPLERSKETDSAAKRQELDPLVKSTYIERSQPPGLTGALL